MKRILAIGLIALVLMLVMAPIAAAAQPALAPAAVSITAPIPQTQPMNLQLILDVIIQFATLAGVAAAISAVVNVFKYFGWVGDGNAGRVVAALDLAAIVALAALKIFAPTISADFVDQQAAIFASIVVLVLGYVMELKVSASTHAITSELRLPLIGASNADRTTLQLAPKA